MKGINLSWYRFLASLSVLRQHPFLVVSAIGVALFDLLMIGIIFVIYYYVSGKFPDSETMIQRICIGGGIILAILSGIISNALMFCLSTKALEGERPQLSKAIQKVWDNRMVLLQWWIFSVIGFLLLNLIQLGLEKIGGILGDKFGQFLASFIGLTLNIGWSFAVYFSVPVLMSHPDKPLPTLKRSVNLIKQNWGEKLTMESGQAVLALLFLVALSLPVIGVHLRLINYFPNLDIRLIYILDGALAVPIVFVFLSLMTALDAVYKASLYRYAETGDYVGPYTPEMFKSGFKSSAQNRKA